MNEDDQKAYQYLKESEEIYQADLIKAMELIEKAIDIVPNAAILWTTKAKYQYDLKNYEAALESVEKAIELKPQSYFAWLHKGLIKRNMEQYEEAAQAYIESLKIKPDFNVYTLLSDVQMEFDVEAALQSAKKALELNPNWDEAKELLKEAEDMLKNDGASE